MAKHVTSQQSKTGNKPRVGANQAKSPGRLKLAYAFGAVVIALGCLYVTILHFHGVGGDNELSLSEARNQAKRTRPFLRAGLSDRASSNDSAQAGNR